MSRPDLPVILGVMMIVTVFVLLLSLFTDFVYGLVDPRIDLLQPRKERRRWTGRHEPVVEAAPQAR